ncbi:MAG: TetR family transcriptional regulator, partial [Chitinivibrionales bacterium]|nr:TetR family transcriptional regulator [Chitinivibrionales bacterium]
MAGRTRDNGKESAIADAGLRLFGKKGFGATSVEEIARAAGVGKGSVYTYYETKADIFVAGVMRYFDRYHQAIEKLMDEIESPVHRLRRIVTTCTEMFDPDNPETIRVSFEILKQAMTTGGVLHQRRHLIRELSMGMRRVVQGTLLEGVSKGVFRPEIARDAEKIAINLLAYLDGIYLHAMVSDKYFDLGKQIGYHLEILLDHLLV